MATLKLKDGQSDNTSSESLGTSIPAGDNRYLSITNLTGTYINWDVSQQAFNIYYFVNDTDHSSHSFVSTGGVPLKIAPGSHLYRFHNTAGSSHALAVGAHGITTSHGTSAQDGKDVVILVDSDL